MAHSDPTTDTRLAADAGRSNPIETPRAYDVGTRSADDAPTPSRGTGRRPRPTGDEAAMPQVQLVLGLLIVFLFLLVLWMVWPVLSH